MLICEEKEMNSYARHNSRLGQAAHMDTLFPSAVDRRTHLFLLTVACKVK